MSTNSHPDAAPCADRDHGGLRKTHCSVRHLGSLHDGDGAVIEAIGIGAPAVPILRALLFLSETSRGFSNRGCGPFRRGRCAQSHERIEEYVRGWQSASDPVERFGDEAVLGTAARFLGATKDEDAYQILIVAVARKYPCLASSKHWEAAGRKESIPIGSQSPCRRRQP